jgi:hypothetical protein
MKLAIAIPHTGTIKSQTVFSLFKTLKDFPYDYDLLLHEGSMLHVMRNRLVKKAIDLKCTHILFLDSDISFEKEAVLKLIKHKKEIVGANYHKRKLPIEATIQNPKKTKGLTTCDSVATGFLLIDLKVFKKLPEPWFFWGKDGESEDFWFCRQAREVGYKVWVDLTIPIGHIGSYIY